MTALRNPTEIAREAFRQLAIRRVPPTPDNYLEIYSEVSGQSFASPFPEKPLKQLAQDLQRLSPDQPRLGRDLDEAIKAQDWARLRKTLSDHVAQLNESQQLAWGQLIGDLLRQWEARSPNLTQARKRESLEHVLESSTSNSRNLYTRLENLHRAWSQGSTLDAEPNPEAAPAATEAAAPTQGSLLPSPPPSKAADMLPEFRELFAYTLESCIAPLLEPDTRLAREARELARIIRGAYSIKQLEDVQGTLKRFTFQLELLVEDQVELRASLLKLLRLVIENIGELVLDDQWIYGQVSVIRDIVDKPLSQRALDDAEQRLKEVIFKQSQLKLSLQEAQDSLKHMLAGFVDHLADFAGATSDYHDKIGGYVNKISAADNINQLETVLTEVMQETRNIQVNALRSRDELQQAQQKVQEAEARILKLEKELEESSHLIRHDQLTGALNRRGLDEIFSKEIARAERHESPLCVALLDIDNFKKFNDSLGHDAGDSALVHLALVIRETLRPQDTVARFGGEEFVVLLPDTALDEAEIAMARVQRELTRRIFLHDNQKLLITFSAGVTQMLPSDDQASAIKRADEAMYQAKQSGKNRVVAG